MNHHKKLTLYCFSPLVMISTFLVEFSAACYTLFKYKTDRAAQLIIAILGCLAFFQLAEYMICEKAWMFSSLDWARLGYIAITMLPPVGLHLGMTIAQKSSRRVLAGAYASAAFFIFFFLFVGYGIKGEQCLGNYVIFSLVPAASFIYGFYYYAWLLTGAYFFWKMKKYIQEKRKQDALAWLLFGYLAFIIPTAVVTILYPETLKGIPSIMCGFAVSLALCLLFRVAPLALKKN